MFRRNRSLRLAPAKTDYQNYANRVSDPQLKERLEKITANPLVQLHNKTVEFLQSLKEQYEKRGSLSHNQVRILEDIEKKYSEENTLIEQKLREDWVASFDATKQETITKVAKWYRDLANSHVQPYYFRDVCERVLNEKSYIPPKSVYDKMVNNKFAQGFLDNLNKQPKFSKGDFVSLTKTVKYDYKFDKIKDLPGGIVIEITDMAGSAKGSRQYRVLFIGSDEVLNVQERYLKRGK